MNGRLNNGRFAKGHTFNKGELNGNFGIFIKQSKETCLKKSMFQKQRYSNLKERNKISISSKIRYKNPEERKKTSNVVKIAMHRPEVRKKHLKALLSSKWLKVKTDKGQLELLEKWGRLGFNFEPNYQVHTDDFLGYVDGYDKDKNIVLEYDGKYHNNRQQKEKDLLRQEKIIKILNPRVFWRYDAINKTFVDVYRSNNNLNKQTVAVAT